MTKFLQDVEGDAYNIENITRIYKFEDEDNAVFEILAEIMGFHYEYIVLAKDFKSEGSAQHYLDSLDIY